MKKNTSSGLIVTSAMLLSLGIYIVHPLAYSKHKERLNSYTENQKKCYQLNIFCNTETPDLEPVGTSVARYLIGLASVSIADNETPNKEGLIISV